MKICSPYPVRSAYCCFMSPHTLPSPRVIEFRELESQHDFIPDMKGFRLQFATAAVPFAANVWKTWAKSDFCQDILEIQGKSFSTTLKSMHSIQKKTALCIIRNTCLSKAETIATPLPSLLCFHLNEQVSINRNRKSFSGELYLRHSLFGYDFQLISVALKAMRKSYEKRDLKGFQPFHEFNGRCLESHITYWPYIDCRFSSLINEKSADNRNRRLIEEEKQTYCCCRLVVEPYCRRHILCCVYRPPHALHSADQGCERTYSSLHNGSHRISETRSMPCPLSHSCKRMDSLKIQANRYLCTAVSTYHWPRTRTTTFKNTSPVCWLSLHCHAA